jgi:hypothetical protein
VDRPQVVTGDRSQQKRFVSVGQSYVFHTLMIHGYTAVVKYKTRSYERFV